MAHSSANTPQAAPGPACRTGCRGRAGRPCGRAGRCRTGRAGRPVDHLLAVVLECRRVGDRLVDDRLERPVGPAPTDTLDRRRPVPEDVNICWRVRTTRTDRCSSRAASTARKHLVLRAQARAEGPADIRRDDANVVGLEAEHVAEIVVDVLHALGLVVDGERAVRLADTVVANISIGLWCSTGTRTRRRPAPAPRRGPCRRGRAASAGGLSGSSAGSAASRWSSGPWRAAGSSYSTRRASRRSGPARGFGDHQGDRLAAEMDLGVVERAERRAGRRDLVAVAAVQPSGGILVREDREHPGQRMRLR